MNQLAQAMQQEPALLGLAASLAFETILRQRQWQGQEGNSFRIPHTREAISSRRRSGCERPKCSEDTQNEERMQEKDRSANAE